MKNYCLGDLISIKHGFAFDGDHISQNDNGIVLVTPGNFQIGGGFQEEKCKFFSGNIPTDYILKPDSFIVTMTDLSKTIDTLGYSALIPHSNRIYLHNQRIGLVTLKNDECDRGYLYWLMRTHSYQRSIANSSTGSTVHHTSPSKIYDFRFKAPCFEKQREIAHILFSYEYLIENNQKQIKLLEEAAQRLYKEWFVDLRFPGWENTKIVDGVPEGWEKTTFGHICTVKKHIINIQENIPSDTPYIGLEHMPRHDFCLSEWGYAQSVSSSKFFFKKGDILFGKIRPYFHKVGFAICNGICSTDAIVMSTEKQLWSLLLMTASSDEFVNHSYQTCKEGSKMPRADWRSMELYPVLIATYELMNSFNLIIESICSKIEKLALENNLLRESLDVLLQKTVSKETEV